MITEKLKLLNRCEAFEVEERAPNTYVCDWASHGPWGLLAELSKG